MPLGSRVAMTCLAEVIQILARRSKNNPVPRALAASVCCEVIIGEPGVGKTAIVEGLARRVVDGDVPQALKDKEVAWLNAFSRFAACWCSVSRGDLFRHRWHGGRRQVSRFQ